MGDAALLDSRANGEVGNGLHVGAAHHPVVVDGDVDEELVEFDVLLLERSCNVVELHARDGEDRLLVHLGVVQAVEQMNAAGAGGGEANTETARELCVCAGHEGG